MIGKRARESHAAEGEALALRSEEAISKWRRGNAKRIGERVAESGALSGVEAKG